MDMKFVDAVKAMEKKTRGVSAYVVMTPDGKDWGRIVIKYGARCYAVAWLPCVVGEKGGSHRHRGAAGGGGYDKATAAMGGASFYNLKTAAVDKLADQGKDFRRQLEDAGYTVIQAV